MGANSYRTSHYPYADGIFIYFTNHSLSGWVLGDEFNVALVKIQSRGMFRASLVEIFFSMNKLSLILHDEIFEILVEIEI